MYYDKQPKDRQDDYKSMLKILGSLSRLFSQSKDPYLHYRAHENIFSKYFKITNNARSDDSADVYDNTIGVGIGLKTWVGSNDQKVAEFGRLRPNYEHLDGIELVKEIAKYRNARIRTTKNAHGLQELLYHVVKRIPDHMCIYEATFDEIDVDKIIIDEKRGKKNNIYFSDGNHDYHFSRSKNTLYMIFDDMILLDQFEVEIYEDPFETLHELVNEGINKVIEEDSEVYKEQLCLRLYSTKPDGTKYVAEKSGLNQWNGARKSYKKDPETGERILKKITPRNPNELYIPYPAVDRKRKDFFPPRDVPFDLMLPNGDWISAKVCQDQGKAIMSNPNLKLGKWLLRDVFELEEGTVVTYEMLKVFNIDSVMFTKLDNNKYTIDFCELGTYEKTYDLQDVDE